MKKTLAALALLLLAAILPAASQTVPLGPRFVLPYQTVVDATGVPIPGAQLFFYASGTNIKINTYSDPLLATPNSNPVVANAAGQFPNIFLSGNYKIVLEDSSNNIIWTADPVYASQTFLQCTTVNAQTGTSYTIQFSDYCKLVTFSNSSAVAVTLPPATAAAGFYPFGFYAQNNGAGTATLTPTSGTIAGAPSLALPTGQAAFIFADGTNWQALTIGITGAIAPNVQSNNYQIAPADCGGMVVETGAFKTITLPASLVGFPVSCIVRVVNGHSSRAQKLAGFPASLVSGCGGSCLWPSQGMTVAIVSGAWVVATAPGRYQVSLPTLNVAASGCSDNNDGLASGAPFCHIQTCINTFHSSFDLLGTNPVCQLADGTYTEFVIAAGLSGEQGNGISISGNAVTPTNVVVQGTTGNPAFFTRDNGILILSNMEVGCNGTWAINASQFSTMDIGPGMTFGTCTGSTPLAATQGGHLDFTGNTKLSGSAGAFAISLGAGSIITLSGTIDCGGGSWAFSTGFVEADRMGQVATIAASTFFTNCGSVTGPRYALGSLANIDTNGGGANFFPGNMAGTTTSQNGIYQ